MALDLLWTSFRILLCIHNIILSFYINPPVCLSCVMYMKMFYPVLTFFKGLLSLMPLKGQMKALSIKTWDHDSSKPQAILSLGLLNVSVKIYNILLSNINTSIDTFSNYSFWCTWIKFYLTILNIKCVLHNKYGQSHSYGIFIWTRFIWTRTQVVNLALVLSPNNMLNFK